MQMKPCLYIALALGVAGGALAQEKPDLLDNLTKSVEQWARDNLDDRALQILKKADQQSVRSLFDEMNRRFQGNSIYELAPLKDTAVKLLPLLQQSKETRPYAEWLRNRLDYLEVADELRRRASVPTPKPGTPPPPPPGPTPEAQRSAWDRQLEKRPLPAGAQTYVPRLKPIFVTQHTPASLVWLAEVESSFNPQARSPAGAAGLFQFMPVTARSLGLALSPQDERLIPEKSGQAAAKYLSYLHRRFADWRLALAAYNAGETRVNNLLLQHTTRSYQVIAPKLPAETQLYVPKIEATLHKREGVTLTSLQVATN
jgi:peptidoglycan lytic transglycosylase D